MKFIINFLFVISLVSLYQCKSNQPLTQRALTGTFINQTLLDNLNSFPYHEIPFYCPQIIFDSTGKAFINNGIEMFSLKTEKKGSEYLLKSAFRLNNQMRDFTFSLPDDQHLILFDTGFTGMTTPSTYSRVLMVLDPEKTFDFYFNKSAISGNYRNIDHPGEEGSYIKFSNEGKIYGWEIYERYQLCYAGDCLSESVEPTKLIMLEKDENVFDFFSWSNHSDTLILTKLGDPTPEMKGSRPLTSIIVRLLRLKQ